MRKLTQTDVVTGNCWQYGIACILELDPAVMPDQVEIESAGNRSSYHNAINEYLVRHHKMMYFELFDWQYSGLRVTSCDGYHMLVGPTVRTPDNKMNHIVVAKDGVMVWDVHPSRAGLTVAEKWGLLSPAPDSFIAGRKERAEKMPVPNPYRCFCPECGGR